MLMIVGTAMLFHTTTFLWLFKFISVVYCNSQHQPFGQLESISQGSNCSCRCIIQTEEGKPCQSDPSKLKIIYSVQTLSLGNDCKCTCLAPTPPNNCYNPVQQETTKTVSNENTKEKSADLLNQDKIISQDLTRVNLIQLHKSLSDAVNYLKMALNTNFTEDNEDQREKIMKVSGYLEAAKKHIDFVPTFYIYKQNENITEVVNQNKSASIKEDSDDIVGMSNNQTRPTFSASQENETFANQTESTTSKFHVDKARTLVNITSATDENKFPKGTGSSNFTKNVVRTEINNTASEIDLQNVNTVIVPPILNLNPTFNQSEDHKILNDKSTLKTATITTVTTPTTQSKEGLATMTSYQTLQTPFTEADDIDISTTKTSLLNVTSSPVLDKDRVLKTSTPPKTVEAIKISLPTKKYFTTVEYTEQNTQAYTRPVTLPTDILETKPKLDQVLTQPINDPNFDIPSTHSYTDTVTSTAPTIMSKSTVSAKSLPYKSKIDFNSTNEFDVGEQVEGSKIQTIILNKNEQKIITSVDRAKDLNTEQDEFDVTTVNSNTKTGSGDNEVNRNTYYTEDDDEEMEEYYENYEEEISTTTTQRSTTTTTTRKTITALTQNCGTLFNLSRPHVVHDFGRRTGAWMMDAAYSSFQKPKIYVTNFYYGNNLIEFKNLENFKNFRWSNSYMLPYNWIGTGHLVFNGSFYYNRAFSKNIIKYNLKHRFVSAWGHLRHAMYDATTPFTWKGHSRVHMAVDESGLWVMYPAYSEYDVSTTSQTFIINKIDPDDLHTSSTWRTTIHRKSLSHVFMVCGVVYLTDRYDSYRARITHAFDTYTGVRRQLYLPFLNRYAYNVQMLFLPKEGKIYSWDKGHQVIYDVNLTY